jgi:hypothetical protein
VEASCPENSKSVRLSGASAWTDGIAESKGRIQPKHCWDAGVIKIQRNDTHGITHGNPMP